MFELLDITRTENHLRIDPRTGTVYFGVGLRKEMETKKYPHFDFAYDAENNRLAFIRHVTKNNQRLTINSTGCITSPRLQRVLKKLMTEAKTFNHTQIEVTTLRENTAFIINLGA